MKTLTILYPGDMGSSVARAFIQNGWKVVSFAGGRSERTVARAKAAGVTLLSSVEECLEESSIVLSAVPQDAALVTAKAFAQSVPKGGKAPIYIDVNSVSPATMTEIASTVTAAGAHCVDGAFVGSAAMLGTKTTLYLSGQEAESVLAQVSGALVAKVIGSDIGTASAFKLSIYGFNKGLVAMFLEMITAADAIGQREELLGCLRAFYPGTMETVDRLLPTYPRHVGRRIDEMKEVVEWLRSIRHRSDMARATRSIFECFHELGLDLGPWSADEVVDECCRRHLLSFGSRATHRAGQQDTSATA